MTDTKGKNRLIINIPAWLLLLIAFVAMPVISFAQDVPCDGTDPYTTCPLDTNVWVLVAIALIAGAFFLYKQRKMQYTKF
ncbi:MAG: hypothetical protein ACTHNW_17815 [Mucilaginibacter sp.]